MRTEEVTSKNYLILAPGPYENYLILAPGPYENFRGYIYGTIPSPSYWVHAEMEFKEFEPRFKSAKTRFKLSAGLNLETFETILSGTIHI